MAWKYITDKSLWTNYMRNKYGNINHAEGVTKIRHGGSSLWKKIKNIIPDLLDNSQWNIGCGNSLFWMDNWC